MPHPRVGVSVICFRDARAQEVLLVQRGKAPALGRWAPPGGSVEWGETVRDAAIREMREETGLAVSLPTDAPFTAVDAISRDEGGETTFHYVLIEIAAIAAHPDATPVAADDAADCRWWPVADLAAAQPQVAGLEDVITMARDLTIRVDHQKGRNL